MGFLRLVGRKCQYSECILLLESVCTHAVQTRLIKFKIQSCFLTSWSMRRKWFSLLSYLSTPKPPHTKQLEEGLNWGFVCFQAQEQSKQTLLGCGKISIFPVAVGRLCRNPQHWHFLKEGKWCPKRMEHEGQLKGRLFSYLLPKWQKKRVTFPFWIKIKWGENEMCGLQKTSTKW